MTIVMEIEEIMVEVGDKFDGFDGFHRFALPRLASGWEELRTALSHWICHACARCHIYIPYSM